MVRGGGREGRMVRVRRAGRRKGGGIVGLYGSGGVCDGEKALGNGDGMAVMLG